MFSRDHIKLEREALTEPMQMPNTFKIKVCINFARGMIATDRTVMIGTR
jgi:hypothetical protein